MVGIALGTAIVPFLDFVGYLLRLNVFKQTGKNLFANERFEQCTDPAFRFILFFSVREWDEAVGLELCQKLQSFCTRKGLANFEFHLRVSSAGQSRWDRDFFAKKLDPRVVKRVYIASVAGTEASFATQMREIGVPDEFITIL